MMLHLSLLAGYVSVGAGFIAPILIWMLKKEEYPELDVHGKNAINWLISHLIYGVVCAVLVLFAIGIPLIIALGIVSIVFPIMAGLKAQKGEVWTYPITIQFLK